MSVTHAAAAALIPIIEWNGRRSCCLFVILHRGNYQSLDAFHWSCYKRWQYLQQESKNSHSSPFLFYRKKNFPIKYMKKLN